VRASTNPRIGDTWSAVLEEALRPFADYEDAVLHEAARGVNADGIVTRNPADFAKAALPIYSPQDLVQALAQA
jgi:hypothetical protein